MAATEEARSSAAQRLLLAALALPGLLAVPAQAEEAPEHASLSLHYMDYRDSQPGLERVHVSAPALGLVLPLGSAWSLQANAVQDTVSGASPRYHTIISSASHFDESRKAADLSLTHYLPRGSVSLLLGRSAENDYVSRYAALSGKWASADQNTTINGGWSVAVDRIDPVNHVVRNERRHSNEWQLGITQVMTARDLAQFSFTRSLGYGYYSDPYKKLDNRPRSRNASIFQWRWNHQLGDEGDKLAPVLRSSYRYYSDSYAIHAHTLGLELVKPLGHGWQITPSLRYYSQSAASFYLEALYDSRLGAPFPRNFNPLSLRNGTYMSEDQRLSAFGAFTYGLQLEKELPQMWSVSASVEYYRQRANWTWFGPGSVNLQGFNALTWQLSLKKSW